LKLAADSPAPTEAAKDELNVITLWIPGRIEAVMTSADPVYEKVEATPAQRGSVEGQVTWIPDEDSWLTARPKVLMAERRLVSTSEIDPCPFSV